MPCSTCSSCGTTGSGSAASGHHRRSAHFAGSTIRGSPVHERAVKKKSIRSSIGSPPRVRCIDGHELQVEVVDADLLAGLAPRGVVRRLALLDVPGRRGRPVAVHVAGVLPQLQQHLRPGVAVSQQEDVRRRDDDEPARRSGGRLGRVGPEGRRSRGRSSSLPSSESSASLALSAPVSIWSAYLPPVLSSAMSAALSMPSSTLSSCRRQVLELVLGQPSFSLASSRKPMSAPEVVRAPE